MMKILNFVGFLLAAAISCEASHTNAQFAMLDPYFVACAKDMGIPGILRRMVAGDEIANSEKAKKLNLCVMVRTRFMDCNANVFMPNLAELYKYEGPDGGNITATVKDCLPAKGTPAEKAFRFHWCFFHNHKLVL